jgi:hypothetical protein
MPLWIRCYAVAMRVSEPFIRSGYFWLPSQPSSRLPGTLSIKNGGEVELEILGNFDPLEQQSLVQDVHPVVRVNGEIERDGLVTLDDCHYRQKSLSIFGGVSKSTLGVSRLVIGCAFDESEKLEFNSFRFTVDGLQEWVRRNAIHVNYHTESTGATINFVLPKDIAICHLSTHEIGVALSFGGALPGTQIDQASVRLDAYIQLSSENLCSVENFTEVAYRIVGFLRLGMNCQVSIKEVYVARYDIVYDFGEDEKPKQQLQYVYQSLPFSQQPPEVRAHSFLFSYPDVQHRIGEFLVNWINAYETLDIVLGLYLAATSGKFYYLTERFLTLARGLETLHRRENPDAEFLPKPQYVELKQLLMKSCPPEHKKWLSQRLHFANEPFLANRLNDLISPFKSMLQTVSEADLLVKRTVKTRNYLTHFDIDSKTKAATGLVLWNICNRLEAILCLQLLVRAGFSQTELTEIMKRPNKLREKFDSSPISD